MKKFISAILCVILISSNICLFASAENVDYVSTVDELMHAIDVAQNGSVIYLKGGIYRVDSHLTFDGIKKNITIKSAPGETAVLTNARAVSDWKECEVNGVKAFCADAEGTRISALFSDTNTLPNTRLPETGYYYIDKPYLDEAKGEGADLVSNGFYADDLAKTPSNLKDVTVEILHQWVSDVDKPVAYDEKTGLMKLARYSGRPIEIGDRYFLENVMDSLDKSGEWCFNSADDKIYYIPFEGETTENLSLFASSEALLIDIENSSGITFENVKFADTGWEYSDDKYLNTNIHTRLRDYLVSSVQGAVDVCGAIDVTYSDNINFVHCNFENIGVNAIRFYTGAKDCTVDSCYFGNIGANAVLVGGRYFLEEHVEEIRPDLAENVTVRNCEIEKYGRQFFGACGIIVTYCDNAEISNNEIHDGYYTGISAGYMWLFRENPTQNIKIKDNLIYDIGTDTLSDLGGIYLLGVQQGTVVSGNVIHDCSCYSGEGGYAGNGIYLDSGCEFMTVKNNLVFNCSTSCFNTTLSKNNTIQNNIFAFAGQSVACLGAEGYGDALKNLNNTYKNNIYLTYNKVPVLEMTESKNHFAGSGNVIWDADNGDELFFVEGLYTEKAKTRKTAERKGWLDSAITINPEFTDAYSYDFTLNSDSNAVKFGFEPFDFSNAGTLKNSTVGLTRDGGMTDYNSDIKEYNIRPARISFAEKIKNFFCNIADFFRSLMNRIFGIESPELAELYTTNYSAGEKNEYNEELTAMFEKVKKHTPKYVVDESRKPFADDERIKAVYFDGEKCNGKETEVFAYIGFPESASADNPVPAMVLVHGGGMHAMADWVQYWVDRGYAAISFDGMAQEPKAGYYSADGNNPDWTVNPDSHLPFAAFDDVENDYSQQWFYYFITDIILADNILRADNRIITDSIGVSGISWGGVATTVAACYDDRFDFAIPVYGCGCLEVIGGMFSDEIINQKWDVAPLLGEVQMPMFFVNGDDDPFFTANATSSSAALAKRGSAVFINGLNHGDFRIEETVRFANENTGKGKGNIKITGFAEQNGKVTVSFNLPDKVRNPKVKLYYRNTPLEYDKLNLKEKWTSISATVVGDKATVSVPKGAVMYYVCVSGSTGSLFNSRTIRATTGVFENEKF